MFADEASSPPPELLKGDDGVELEKSNVLLLGPTGTCSLCSLCP